MVNGRISLENARCQLAEAEASRIVDGLYTSVRMKQVKLWDPETDLEVQLLFTNGEFNQFLKTLKGEEE